MEEKEEIKEEITQEKNEVTSKEEKTIKNKGKKKIIFIICIIILLLIAGGLFYLITNDTEKLPPLPKPEITSGARGELGIDKNINESTIDKYLGRSDSVYRDMRMLEDPSKYEKIGGDRFLSGYIKGFEVIPLPYIIPVEGLPEEVGDTYIGDTLFHIEDGKYIANYDESLKIIEKIFPKDKVIFLMCGGGGYAGMTKNFLVSLGWDENKIYNIGGHWYYKGKNNIKVPKNEDGSYNFKNVPYHKINFKKLTKSTNYKIPNYRVNEVKISTDKIEIEEGSSFKLNAIVLPNEAANKELKWKSNDENIATVDSEGLVKAIKVGETTITVTTVDKNREANCKVTIKKKPEPAKLKLDNISSYINEFYSFDTDSIEKEFKSLTQRDDGELKDEYVYINEVGNRVPNDSWTSEYKKYQAKVEDVINKRINIVNKMADNKNTFIFLIHTESCDEREYSVIDGAEKILKEQGYENSYLRLGENYYTGDQIFYQSKLFNDNVYGGSIVIIKDGSLFTIVDQDRDSIKNEEETINWLSKYIDLK